MANYQSFIITLDQWGLRDVLIPFALIFTVCFALLQKLKIFKSKDKTGKDEDKADKKLSTILSLGITVVSLIPHFSGNGFDIVLVINEFLPSSFLLLFVVLLFLALIGTVSSVHDKKPGSHPLMGMLALVAVFILVIILLQSARQIDYPFLDFLNNPNTQAVVIVILVFVLIIWYINKKPSEPTKPEDYFKKFKDTMKKMFEGQ